MMLPVDCSQCGATGDVDGDALRAGTAKCEFCGAKLEPPKFDIQLEAVEPWLVPGVMATVQKVTGLGIVEAKKLVDGAPCWLVRNVTAEDAEKVQAAITGVGGKTTMTPAKPQQ